MPGPIPVEEPVVIDGDSFKGWAVLLPGQRQEITVRIRGIDAPELRGACASEREAALAARNALARLLHDRVISRQVESPADLEIAETEEGRDSFRFHENRNESRPIFLTEVNADKYYGRVVAQVRDADGRDVAAALLAAGHARPYDGGRRGGWCAAR